MFCNIFYQMLWENVVLIYSNQVRQKENIAAS